MPVSLPQALLIGLLYFAANTSFLGGLGYFTTWRPLVNGLLVGIVLGDPERGLMTGALINILYLGYMSVGGTLGTGDAALAGILGSTVAITAAVPDSAQAAGLGVLVGVLLGNLGFALLSLRMSLDNRIVRRIEQCADRGNSRAVVWWNIVPAQALLLAITLPAAGILAYVVPPLLNAILVMAPSFLLRGLGLAGSSLAAALGIALAMKFVFTGRGVPAFLVGFALYTLTQADFGILMPAALILLAARELAAARIRPKEIYGRSSWLAFILWQFFSHSSYSFERLQGSGLAAALAPAIGRLYPDAQERTQALQRHLAFFNVEPNWGSVLAGTMLKLEEEHAIGRTSAASIIETRQVLMGAISGFGDSVSQGALLPLVLSTALPVVMQPHGLVPPAAGVLIYLALICPLMLAISSGAFFAGYRKGRDAVVAILSSPMLKRWIAVAETAGAFMLGVLAATRTVTGLTISTGNSPASLLLNAAGQLTIVMLCYLLVKPLNIKPSYILIGAVVISLVAAAMGLV